MSIEMLNKFDGQIQEAKVLLEKVEAKAGRLREAIATFKAEKKAALASENAPTQK